MVPGSRFCVLLAGALVMVVTLSACGGDDDQHVDLSPGVDPASSTTTTLAPDSAVSSPAQTLPADKSRTEGVQLVKPSRRAVDVRPLTFDVAAAKAVDGGVLVPF